MYALRMKGCALYQRKRHVFTGRIVVARGQAVWRKTFACPISVKGIAEERTACVRHMYPDLVGPAGFQGEADKSELLVCGQSLVMSEGGFSVGRDTHPLPALGIIADGSADSSGGRIWHIFCDRQIAFEERAVFPLAF